MVALRFGNAENQCIVQLSLNFLVALTDTEARLVGAGAAAESQD